MPPDTLAVATTPPAVVRLPPRTLPVAVIVPAMLAPRGVTTNTLVTPPTEVLTLPLIVGIATDVVPLANELEPVSAHVRLPVPSVCRNWLSVPPAILTLLTSPRVDTEPTVRLPRVVRLPPETSPLACTTPAVVRLPPITLPVATTSPAVSRLAPRTLPVA